MEADSHCSVLLEDFLQLLGLGGFPSFGLRPPRDLFSRRGGRRGLLQILLVLDEDRNKISESERKMFEWEDKDGQHIMKEAQRILIYGTFSYFKA